MLGRPDPTPGDLDRVVEPGPGGPLDDLVDERWTARCVVAFDAGRPVEVYVRGYSGD